MKLLFRLCCIIVIITVFCSPALGATLQGNIYDLSLEKTKAVVTINTIPLQRIASTDGTYSFDVASGSYTLRAEYDDGLDVLSVQENITIQDNGTYTVDLVLFPEFDDFDVGDIGLVEKKKFPIIPVVIGAGILLIIYFIFNWKTKRDDKKINAMESIETGVVLDILKKQGGRATQKEIRKELPLSEAKVSLMIAELESEGKVKKIKKGRGNIIVLNK